MSTIVFCPITFNLAEVTRMIEVARALDPRHRAVFQGYEHDFAHLIVDAGFEYRPSEPSFTEVERRQALRFDQGKTLRSPFTDELVAARVGAERRLIREVDAAAVVIGTNPTSMISARAEGVPLFYPVPFALTRPQVEPENTRFDDHRFFYARSDDGGPWQVHQVAKAGRALFAGEEDYTGLIAIDPYDADSVYAATHIDPRDGTELAHHEIFHGRTGNAGATWTWTPVTTNSGVDNLRPIVVPGDPSRVTLLWFRGTMSSSQHYDCEIAAHVQPRA